AGATGALRGAVLFLAAPPRHRRLVAPERQRQDLVRRRQALEALDRDEAVDPFELRPQPLGDVEIVLAALGLRLDLENHRMHRAPFLSDPAGQYSRNRISGESRDPSSQSRCTWEMDPGCRRNAVRTAWLR